MYTIPANPSSLCSIITVKGGKLYEGQAQKDWMKLLLNN